MAPEQVERPLEVDHRADIYSLGVVFYELLTGQLPVGHFPMPSEKAGTAAFLDEVVLRALEREPERRYQHASEVKTDIQRGGARSAEPAPGPGRDGLEAVRQRVSWPAAGLRLMGVLSAAPFILSFFCCFVPFTPGRSPERSPDPVLNVLLGLGATFLYFFPTAAIFWAGGTGLKYLKSRTWALIAAVLALILPPTWPIGLPVGLWALLVLTRPEVKAAFVGKPASFLELQHDPGG
jgi:hypothetical protein